MHCGSGTKIKYETGVPGRWTARTKSVLGPLNRRQLTPDGQLDDFGVWF